MKFLRQIIREEIKKLLLLTEINEQTILYHASDHNWKPNNIIYPKKEKETGLHWKASDDSELKMEVYRRDNYPDKVSRLDCVYTTVVPSSRFKSWGDIYEVIPIGKFHVSDSRIVDEIWDKKPNIHSLCERYWNPPKLIFKKSNTKNLEVLCEKVKVVKKLKDIEYRKGDIVQIKVPIEFRNDNNVNTLMNPPIFAEIERIFFNAMGSNYNKTGSKFEFLFLDILNPINNKSKKVYLDCLSNLQTLRKLSNPKNMEKMNKKF